MKTEVEAKIEELLSEGTRWNVIAKTLHVSNRTIAKVSKRMDEPTSPPPSVSEVFEMFDDGKEPTDVVKETNADPTKIREWFNEWLTMKKGWRDWQEFKTIASEKDGKEKGFPPVRKDWRGYMKRET